MDDAGDPAEERQRDAQEEAEDSPSHQDGNGRKDDAKKVAQRFQGVSSPTLRTRSQLARTGHLDRGVCFFQSSGWIGFASLPQFFLAVDPLAGVGLRLGGLRRVIGTTGQKQAANSQESESKMLSLHHKLIRVHRGLWLDVLKNEKRTVEIRHDHRGSFIRFLLNENEPDYCCSARLGRCSPRGLRNHRNHYDDPHARAKLDVRAIGRSRRVGSGDFMRFDPRRIRAARQNKWGFR
jgi:hypothetical protein